MGDTADQLLIKILSWLEQKERCAQHMWNLVKELEDLRKKESNIEHVVSGSTVADAQNVEKQSETIEVEIMKLIKRLKMERAITGQDEDEYIAQCFARAMWGKAHTGKPPHCASIFLREAPILLGLLYTFSMFGKDGKDGKITGSLVKWGVQQLALPLATAGGKTAVESATKLLGPYGTVFALNESIDNFKEMVKKNISKAIQSLRESAEKIDEFCKELRNERKIIEYAIFRKATEHDKSGMWMGLLNVRSMAPKTKAISDIIVHYNLDVLLTTETWLKPANFERVLREACPSKNSNFTFYHQSRVDDVKGGGVGIQHTELYSCQQIRYSDITMFEYVAVVLKKDEWEVPVLLVNMYFPPAIILKEFQNCISEFKILLGDIINPTQNHDHVIFTGDFNIHKALGNKFSQFNDLLKEFGMMQYVEKPTHNQGRTLDLVFTRNVDVSDLIVVDPHISDHYIVIFKSIPVAPNKKRKL